MPTINPYLSFNGNAEEVFNFYKEVFGGEFSTLQRYKDTPEADKVPAGSQDKIMHVALPIGKGNTLMASDVLESMGYPLTVGNNFQLSVDTESAEETTRLFNALSTGGKVTVPLSKQFWGAYFGMFTDKFGVNWMISHNEAQQSN
jgi:PhnB protein